jgi:lathosterol oxidase
MSLFTSFGRLDDLPTMFLLLALTSLLLYFGLAGAGYYFFFVCTRGQHAEQKMTPLQPIGSAIRLSVVSIFGNALLTAPVVVLIVRGFSRVYCTVTDHGWGYLLLSIFALLVFTETLVYWIHRALHLRSLYRLIHRHHHAFRAPTPWASLAFHPLDAFAQALPYHLFAFLFPIHVGVYAGALMAITFWAFLIHEPPLLFPEGWPNLASHHAIHHTCNKHNYGQFSTLWDRIAKTYRHPKGEVHITGLG